MLKIKLTKASNKDGFTREEITYYPGDGKEFFTPDEILQMEMKLNELGWLRAHFEVVNT